MKNKICKYCRKIIDYKEWKMITLIDSDWHWNKKKFCDANCSRAYWEKRRRTNEK